jgi:nucleoside-diphosphate-sugar epimerase
LAAALAGSDVVVHTVYGGEGDAAEQWAVGVDGTRAVLAAARRAGVRRFVQIDTVAVHDTGRATGGRLDEDTPLLDPDPADRGYAQQKLAARRMVLAAAGELEVSCVAPTVVYGPWAPSWTLAPLRRLAAGADLPTGEGPGICNALHVHDLAAALAELAAAPGPVPDRLLVSGPEAVPWGRFYDAYRDMLGLPRSGSVGGGSAEDWERPLYADATVVRTDRLRAAGFSPRIGFADGMAQVAAWARWAGMAR